MRGQLTPQQIEDICREVDVPWYMEKAYKVYVFSETIGSVHELWESFDTEEKAQGHARDARTRGFTASIRKRGEEEKEVEQCTI